MSEVTDSSAPGAARDHATRTRLIETVMDLMERHDLAAITSPMVLAAAGVSKGSLYHHFHDFDELIGEAAIRRFSTMANRDIAAINAAAASAHDAASLIANLAAVTADSQSGERRARRRQRARLIAQAHTNKRLAELLAIEQARLTDCFIQLTIDGQARGWVSPSLDPHAVAVLVQAYTFGRVIDDISTHQVDPAQWDALIGQIVTKVLCTPE